jgi:hypothetical protein
MNRKSFLMATAAAEAGISLAMAIEPSLPVSMLFGGSLDSPVAVVLLRVLGAALLTLSIACWLARNDGHSQAGRGLITAVLFYDLAVTAVLVNAALRMHLAGPALWPAVGLHVALAIWCVVCLWRGR